MITQNTQPILTGIAASVGTAEGTVRLVNGVEDNNRFQDGDILVTRITDPTMVMMMARASAIVCDIGGITSHPSLVAREMGIPCIVNAQKATTMLKDGQRVRVDGMKGEVYAMA